MDKKTDEINLFDFLIQCWNAFVSLLKKILNIFLQIVRFSLRNIVIIGLCAIFGLGAGYYFSRPNVAKYNYETTVTFRDGMKPYVYDAMRLFFSASRPMLEENYGLDCELMGSIDRVNYYNVVDANVNNITNTIAVGQVTPLPNANVFDNTLLKPDFIDYTNTISAQDSLNVIMPDRVHLQITMDGMQPMDKIKNALKRYVNNIPEVKSANANIQRTDSIRLIYYDRELDRLDSLSNYEYFQRDIMSQKIGDNSTAIIEAKYRPTYEAKILMLMNKRDYLKNRIDNNPDVINFQSSFVPTPTMPRTHKWFYGALLGMLLGYGISLLWVYRKQIIAYLKNK